MIRMKSNSSFSSLRINSRLQRSQFCRRQSGFTLVELIAILAVMSAIIGVLVPTVQKKREASNKAKSQRGLVIIKNAQKAFFDANGHFSTSFAELGLDQQFQCVDPECHVGRSDGYVTQLDLGGSDQEFTATAIPAALGKTGSAKCVIDQTADNATCGPIPEAEAARQQMFANIRAQALQTMFQLLLQRTPSEVPEIARGVESADSFPRAFRQLDADGDGQVTIQEILNYQGLGSDVMGDFLQFLGRELELGAGGENVDALPGVTLADLQIQPPNPNISMIQGNLVGLWRNPPPQGDFPGLAAKRGRVGSVSANESPISLPAVQLSGFCDGSARISWQPGQQVTLPFTDATFFAQLNPDDPENTTGAAGTFTLVDHQGNLIGGILIGLTQPASGGGVNLQSLIIGTESGGQWWSPSLGNGGATISIGNDTRGSFNGQFQMVPAVQ